MTPLCKLLAESDPFILERKKEDKAVQLFRKHYQEKQERKESRNERKRRKKKAKERRKKGERKEKGDE